MRELLRWLWTQITSMRTALVLLFLLALTAVPGSFIPQESSNPVRVGDYATQHPWLDKVFKPLGFYHVYTSPWFSAVYLLLFVSLIGCIIPRIGVYLRALRTPPPRMPSRLDRLPDTASLAGVTDSEASVEAARQWLAAHHFRTARRDGVDGVGRAVPGVSAERGYLREFGNLLFHVSMVFVLVGVAITQLYGYKGTAQVVVGTGFSNNITQYDQFSGGVRVDSNNLNPFTVALKKFDVRFETGPVQTGAARGFDATVDVTADGRTTTHDLQVNHPLNIDGTKVHLLGHGYAPHVTVRDGQGNVALSGPVICQPLDGNFKSSCVINAPDARPDRIAFQGFFLPTGVIDPKKGPSSIFPDAWTPSLWLTAWSGRPRVEDGLPHNVFTLDTTGMTQMKSGKDLLRIQLVPGQGYKLPNGQGSLTFDGWSRWANLQISRTPGLWVTVGSIGLAVLGLCLSLFIRPRRLWLRVLPDAGGMPLVECGGLDRADARTGLSDDVRQLLAAATGTQPEAIEVRSRDWAASPARQDADTGRIDRDAPGADPAVEAPGASDGGRSGGATRATPTSTGSGAATTQPPTSEPTPEKETRA